MWYGSKKSYEPTGCNPPDLGGAEPRLFGEATVWAGRRSSIGLLLRSGERDGAEPDADAFDRRAIHKEHPEFGVPRMTRWLRDDEDQEVNHKRIAGLMQKMGLQAITPGPHTSKPTPGHRIYPYLLRKVKIERVNQVWSTDITYIPMRHGFMYLAAVIDWRSRYVLSWELSNTMENMFCVHALEGALRLGQPEIFNTDQGAQFTSEAFTGVLLAKEIAISMDGRGRALDNVFIERLWWTVKYENVYPKDYADGHALHRGLGRYFDYYNNERKHSELDNATPGEVFGC